MKHRLLAGFILLLLIGCEDQGTPPPAWLRPHERWKSYGLQDYAIDQSRLCFCPDGGQTMRLTIRAGAIETVTRLSDSMRIALPESRWYLTVDSMFAIIRNPGSDSILVAYNELYGYPERLDINPQQHPVDGGVLYVTSNLRIP